VQGVGGCGDGGPGEGCLGLIFTLLLCLGYDKKSKCACLPGATNETISIMTILDTFLVTHTMLDKDLVHYGVGNIKNLEQQLQIALV